MPTLEDLRLKILDRPQVVLDEKIGTGDGVIQKYRVRHYPVMDGSCVTHINGEVTTDCFLELTTGLIRFNDPVKEHVRITASYDFAAFTDDELQKFINDADGNIATAAGKALEVLIADRERLVTWSRSSTKIDYDQLRIDLNDVAKRFLMQGQQEKSGRTEVDWEEVI